jgi:AbrB family looped-hinge helix DNA binding protein
MAQTKLSTKYQMVVPLAVREKIHLEPGQTLHIEPLNDTDFRVSTKSPIDRMYERFGGTKLWGENPDSYLEKARQDRELV